MWSCFWNWLLARIQPIVVGQWFILIFLDNKWCSTRYEEVVRLLLVLKRAFLSADRNDPVNGLSLASGQWSLSIQCKYSTENLPVDFFLWKLLNWHHFSNNNLCGWWALIMTIGHWGLVWSVAWSRCNHLSQDAWLGEAKTTSSERERDLREGVQKNPFFLDFVPNIGPHPPTAHV